VASPSEYVDIYSDGFEIEGLIGHPTVVEQYRLLHGMLQVIKEVNTVTGLPICNESTCPTM
jgi:hypothetical protein